MDNYFSFLKKINYNFSSVALVFGYIFLYIPIVLLIIYSFNKSRLVTVWGGFSVKWYGELFKDSQILQAVWMSLRIAFINATVATVLGTISGYIMSRYHKFFGRTLFSGMVSSPLVMPDVIIGLSLLLLFVTMEVMLGWPAGRGMTTIILAHITFSMAYVHIIVQSRLASFDRTLEEAAMDLGSPPRKIFFVITLPIIWPALVSGWLLTFTLSLDDLVIASFVSGPASTTLPMVVYSSVRLGVSPKINALATLLVLFTTLILIIAGLAARYSNRTLSAPSDNDDKS